MTQATSDALAGLPQVPPLEAAAGRHLLVAPANYAGQGHALAQAVADHLPGWTAANLTISWAASPLRFPCDAFLTYSEWAEPGRRQWVADSLLSPASHVLLEDLKPVIDAAGSGPQASRTTKGLRDARALLASGRRVAVLLHGSSARTPGRHRTLYPFSPFGPDSEAQTGPYAHLSSDIQAAIQRLRLPVFVTTPDMLDFVEGAHWVPSVLMAADFAPAPPWAPSGRLKVAHAPSRSIFKGSRFVDAALERLDQAGVIEYVRLSGVPPLELPGVIRSVDVVVDQVVMGNPGVLLNQTLAAGRLAVATVTPAVRRRYPEPPPIVEAASDTLADVIADIAWRPSSYAELAAQGPGFARALHDGTRSAAVLAQYFLN